jgi:hypothetical protein
MRGRRKEEGKRLIAVVDRRQCQRRRDRWTEGIVGPGHAQTIIFLERATISTIVLVTGYVSAREGLWGEKWVGWKPLLPHACNHALAQGHNPGTYEEGASEKELVPVN